MASDKLQRYWLYIGGNGTDGHYIIEEEDTCHLRNWCKSDDVEKLEAAVKSLREALEACRDRVIYELVDVYGGVTREACDPELYREWEPHIQAVELADELLRSREASSEPNTATHPAKEADKQP